MDATIQAEYWKTGSQYDLDTAQDLFEKGRYPYALFFCHLAVEKALKALWVMTRKEHPPRSHNLLVLAENIPVQIDDAVLDLLAELNAFNLEARYPDLARSLYKKAQPEYTLDFINRTQGVMEWLLQRLSVSFNDT